MQKAVTSAMKQLGAKKKRPKKQVNALDIDEDDDVLFELDSDDAKNE
jgi:hypothetical protein